MKPPALTIRTAWMTLESIVRGRPPSQSTLLGLISEFQSVEESLKDAPFTREDVEDERQRELDESFLAMIEQHFDSEDTPIGRYLARRAQDLRQRLAR